MITLETVRKLASRLPGAIEEPSYGTPGFKVRKKLFARLHQKEDAIVVRIEPDARERLLSTDPMTFYITDHYVNYPWVLVRPTASTEEFRQLLENAWRMVAPTELKDEFESGSRARHDG